MLNPIRILKLGIPILTFLLVMSISLTSLSVQAGNPQITDQPNRRALVETARTALASIIPTLINAEIIKDPQTLSFLNAVQDVLQKNGPPEFVFVSDRRQFVINPGEEPRLMRTPVKIDTDKFTEPTVTNRTIFVNEADLNSPQFQLSFVQIIKILLHEIGHKTLIGTVGERDRWAQNIESLLSQSLMKAQDQDTGTQVELLSLPISWIQRSIVDHPVHAQPTFWLLKRRGQQAMDLTPELTKALHAQSISSRSLNTEIQLAYSTAVGFLAKSVAEHIRPVMDPIMGFLNSMPGREGDPVRSIDDPFSLNKFPEIKALVLFEPSRLVLIGDDVVMDGAIIQTHSHYKNHHMSITGIPWSDKDQIPIQARVGLNSYAAMVPEQNWQSTAKARVLRKGSTISAIYVDFECKSTPYFVDLIVEYSGGYHRIRDVQREQIRSSVCRATFEVNEAQAQFLARAERIIIDNKETRFLENTIDFPGANKIVRYKAITDANIDKNSIGLWGARKNQWVLEKKFSHVLDGSFMFVAPSNTDSFVLHPYNIVAEMDILEPMDVLYAELFLRQELIIYKPQPGKDQMFEMTVDNVVQRYAANGTIMERKSLNMSILMNPVAQKEAHWAHADRANFKKVRLKAMIPTEFLRPLAPDEAHNVPMIAPFGLRVVFTDGRSYTHMFPSKISESDMKVFIENSCADQLRAAKTNPK